MLGRSGVVKWLENGFHRKNKIKKLFFQKPVMAADSKNTPQLRPTTPNYARLFIIVYRTFQRNLYKTIKQFKKKTI